MNSKCPISNENLFIGHLTLDIHLSFVPIFLKLMDYITEEIGTITASSIKFFF